MLVVADGMGGHAAGELAVRPLSLRLRNLIANPRRRSPHGISRCDRSNDELSRVIGDSPDFAGMVTTVTALSWEGDRVAGARWRFARVPLADGHCSN